MPTDLVGSERVRRYPHRRPRSAPRDGVSGGPGAYGSGAHQNASALGRCQSLIATRELVDDEHPESPTIMGSALDEIVGPDMIAMLRPQVDSGAVGQRQPATFRLLLGHFEPLALPDPLDAFVVTTQPAVDHSSSATF